MFCVVAIGSGSAQSSKAIPHTVLDTDAATVTAYDVPDGQSVSLKTQNGDAIAILSAPVSWTPATEIDSEGDAEPGEALFLVQGTKRLFYSNFGESSAFSVYLIDLKHHWATPMRACDEPKHCVRRIKIGHRTLGESRSFFTNGEVSADRYQLLKGSTFTLPNSRVKSDVLLVALSPLTATAGEQPVNLQAGQAQLFPKSNEIAVTASSGMAMWVVVRMPATE